MCVCLSLFANYKWQLLLDRLGKCLVSTVNPSSHEIASQFGLAICLQAKIYSRVNAPVFSCMNQRPGETAISQRAIPAVTVDRQRPVEKATTTAIGLLYTETDRVKTAKMQKVKTASWQEAVHRH